MGIAKQMNSTSQESFRHLRGGILSKKIIKKFWPLIIIFGLVAAFAYPWWAKGRVPFPADYLVNNFPPWQYFYAHPVKNNAMPDVVSQMYPWKHLVMKMWKAGQVPLWNPFSFGGTPLLASYQTAVFHPANLLFFILPEVDAWSLMILLQPLLAGIFTYFFCRSLKLSQVASLMSAIAFMFCGFMTCWLAYGTMSFALLWLPLVLYALEKKFYPLASLALAASFFCGHFQISLYVLLAAVGWLIFSKKIFPGIFFLILGFSLAAVQLLPTLELHQLSSRSQAYGIGEIVPWKYWPTTLAPDFFGNPVTRNDWFGHYAEWASFAGVIPLLLAIFSLLYCASQKLFRRLRGKTLFFVALALASFLLAKPTFLLRLIEQTKIPVLSTSAAARIFSLFSFAIAILAGFGLDSLKKTWQKKSWLPLVFGLGVVAFFGFVWFWLLVFKPLPPDKIILAKRNLILPTAMAFAFVALIAGRIMMRPYKGLSRLTYQLSLLVLVGLTAFDLFRFSHKWQPFDQRAHVYPPLPILEYLSAQTPPDRVFGYFGMEMQNYAEIHGFNGYNPLFIKRYGELLLAADQGTIQVPGTRGVGLARRGLYTIPLLNLMGGRYILHAKADNHYEWAFNFWDYPDQFKQIYADDQYEVYLNQQAYPRAFVVYDYQVVDERQAIIDTMFAAGVDLRRTVILEKDPGRVLTIPTKPAETEILSFVPNKIKLGVKTETSGLLFLSEVFYPGWQARVNDQPVKIYRADYTFRAVPVPAGQSEVEFIYRPASFRWGLVISGASLAAIIFSLVFFKK